MAKEVSMHEEKISEIINKERSILKESNFNVNQTRKEVEKIERKILENNKKIVLLL